MSIILPKLESFLYLLVSRIPFPDSGFQIPAFHMPNVKHLGVDTSVNYIAPVENSALLSFARILRKVLEMQRKTGF